MATLPIYDRSGAEVGTMDVDPAELSPKISKQLLHDVVVMYQANLRQGTFKTKSRGEVIGSTKKMFRQKGTGNARMGPKRTPIRRGGGHAFAKRPRDFSYRLPKKAIRSATRMAMASRIMDNEVTLIDQLAFAQPKTAEMAKILKALKLDGRLLVAVEKYDVNVLKSIRNLAGVTVMPVAELNALTILHPRRVLMTKAALETFVANCKAKLAGNGQAAPAAEAAPPAPAGESAQAS
jgi:large subunit ribosomal protein L4